MQNFQAERCMHTPANRVFSGPIGDLLSVLCILMNIFSHASAAKKEKRLKGFKFALFLKGFKFALFFVFFNRHHCSERVNSLGCWLYLSILYYIYICRFICLSMLFSFVCPCSFLFGAKSTFHEWFPHQCSAQQFGATPISHSVRYELFGLGLSRP